MAYRSLLIAGLVVLLVFQALSVSPQVHAEETKEVETNVAPPKIEEPIGAVPTGSTTDTQTQEREKRSMKRSGEKFQFQAEVHRLMDILINSLYSNKDVFLRELISNASDALDKIRFLSLTDKAILGDGDNTKLEIQIKLDKENKVLSIRDRGIGMTKEDLIKNLGTIAKSGTSAFLEKMQKSGDINLIGQFGVGFYSVYLVGDYVEVRSKSNEEDKQYVWASSADGAFEVYEDAEGDSLGRGTEIRIHLKEEASEYLSEDKLKELVKKYSQFINFPIYLWESKEVDVEVKGEEEEVESDEEKEGGEGDDKDKGDAETEEEEKDGEEEEKEEDEDEEKEEEEKKKPPPRLEKQTRWSWELLNSVKAIWLRSPKEVSDSEYLSFYQSLSKDYSSTDKPLAWSHFSAEGDVEFKSLLFIPPRAAYDMYDNYYSTKAALKLFVRRVFISDEFEELLPKYLNFIKGLVDSDTLPLNVSREMLQAHSSLKTIRKKLVRKALDMIRRLAEEEEEAKSKAKEEREKEGEDKKEDPDRVPSDAETKYEDFWREYGKALKLGVIEDSSNRMRLAKLLRFQSTHDPEKLTSLESYVSRMRPGQKHIFFITGADRKQMEKSPFLERLLQQGSEVLLLTEPVDEYLMQSLTDFDDHKFQNASKDDLRVGGGKGGKVKALKEKFKGLMGWWKEELGGKEVEGVKLSTRLSSSPCVVVTSKYGWSANMERIMTAQALGDPSRQSYLKGRKTLEVNARHPIVKELRERVERDPKDPTARAVASTLYETALIESGFSLEDPTKFAERIFTALRSTMNIDPEAKVDEEEEEEGGEEESTASEEGVDSNDDDGDAADLDVESIGSDEEDKGGEGEESKVEDSHDEL